MGSTIMIWSNGSPQKVFAHQIGLSTLAFWTVGIANPQVRRIQSSFRASQWFLEFTYFIVELQFGLLREMMKIGLFPFMLGKQSICGIECRITGAVLKWAAGLIVT